MKNKKSTKKVEKDSFNDPVFRDGKQVGYASGKKNAKNIERIFAKKKK